MKLKNILFIAIAILTIGLFVACNDEVVATKDNALAYTQVLESNGAFEYNGVKYETLQDALNAIANGKSIISYKTIKVLRSVKGPAAAIAEDQSIELDLGGNTLTFIDVKDSALTAGKGVVLAVKNGTMTLDDKTNADLVAVKAVDATLLYFDNVNVNAEGQKSLDVDGDTTVFIKEDSVFKGDVTVADATLNISDASVLDGGLGVADANVFLGNSDTSTATITGQIDLVGTTTGATTFNTRKDTVVTGKVIASGGKDNVTLGIENELPDVELKGATLNVASTGHVTVTEYSGSTENDIVSTNGESAITDATTTHDIVVTSGLCEVVNTVTGDTTYYGSIKEALDDVNNANQTIKLLDDDTQDLDANLTIPYNVTIDLNGKDIHTTPALSIPVITLADGVTLTVVNNNSTAISYLYHAIKSADGGTSSLVSESAIGGYLVFMSEITLTGILTDGKVSNDPAPAYSNGSTFKESITVSGNATFYASTFEPSNEYDRLLKAGTLWINGATFNATSKKVYSVEAEAARVQDENAIFIAETTGTIGTITASGGGNITLESVTGTSGDIATIKYDSEAESGVSGTITIDNSAFNTGSDKTLATGPLCAWFSYPNGDEYITVYGDITVKGGNGDNIVTVKTSDPYGYVSISWAKDVMSSYAVFKGDIGNDGTPVASLTAENSTFEEDIYSGSVTADYSTLGNSAEDDVFASTITIRNSTLNLGKVMKSYTVYPSDPDVAVAADLIKLADVSGTLKEAYVAANNAVDYTDNIVGTDTYYAFYLSNSGTTAALDVKNITSAGGTGTKPGDTPVVQTVQAVYVNNSSNGNITSSGVTVEPVLTSVAATSGDVYIGNSGTGKVIIDGTITGNDIVLAGVTVKRSVTATNIEDNPSTDVNEADAGSIVATSSTFVPVDANNKLLKAETVSITDSTFNTESDNMFAINATGADYEENNVTKSALYITNTTGTVASLISKAGSIDVENGSADARLTVTGNVLAGVTTGTTYDVTLIGHLPAKNIEVNGTIDGNDIVLTQASVKRSVTAYDVADDATTTEVNEADAGSIVATSSTFANVEGNSELLKAGTVSITDSTFNSISSKAFGIETTGADYEENNATKSALYITNTTGTVASLTSEAGSINVANSDATATLTVRGAVTASDDVTLVGKADANVVVRGDITGKDLSLTLVTFTAYSESAAISGSTVSIASSIFDGPYAYALTATGVDTTKSALYVTGSTGTVASLSATGAGSIDVENSSASATLTVTGNVRAHKSTDFYNVKLVGNSDANVVVLGSICGNDVVATATTLGNSTNTAEGDYIFASTVSVTGSKMKLAGIMKDNDTAATSVTIKDPVFYATDTASAVGYIGTEKLSVNADNEKLIVDSVSITGTSTINSIAGGTYKALTFKGTGVVSSTLTISKGLFYNPGSTAETSDDSAGDFDFITGTTWIVGTYTSDYSVYMWGLDSLNSNTSIECAYIQSSKLSNLPNIVARVNQTSSDQKIYINYDPYYESTSTSAYRYVEIGSGAPEYNFSTTGMVYDVVLNFDYNSNGYTLTSGLYVTGTARPTFKFGNNNISVEGCIFVTGEATLYSTLDEANFVFLATAPSSETHEWIVALPAEAEGNLFKYKAGSYSLASDKLMIAKNRILISNSTDGTDVASTVPNTESFWQYYYNSGAASVTVYCAKGTGYDVAHLETGTISSPATYTKISSWGSNVIGKFFDLSGGSSSNTIWTNEAYSSTDSDVWCYGYNGTSTLTWRHYTTCPSTGHHIVVDRNGGTF